LTRFIRLGAGAVRGGRRGESEVAVLVVAMILYAAAIVAVAHALARD
jgi:hypothetical protein